MARRAWTSDSYRWEVEPVYDGARDLGTALRTAPLVAQLLYNRGIDAVDDARSFLRPELSSLHDPAELPGCAAAAVRLARAVEDGRKVVVYGDYDVDGITGAAILVSCIRMCGGEADFYVPHRIDEGYGLNAGALEEIVDGGAGMVVTVDCGICSADLVSAFSDRVEILVTDHHSLPQTLPAGSVVHPHLGDTYPNPHLCGAGVAFKLAWQTAREVCGANRVNGAMRDFLLEATSLAGLGTIADYVPLVGENRIIATYGLRGLPAAPNHGVKALLESAGLANEEVDAYHVGFVLAPRLNAAGRMGHAREAIELLTTDDPGRAAEIAAYLKSENERRRRVERDITAQAMEMVDAEGMDDPAVKAIVLASKEWHGGVIGIVASRLVDAFCRPAVVIDIGDNGVAQGSARSIAGFHMAAALTACGEHLVSCGGHEMAGGLRLEIAKIAPFADAFRALAAERITDGQLVPRLAIDAESTVAELGYPVVRAMETMGPFGPGNPRPTVVLRNCEIAGQPRRMGRRGETISVLLDQGGSYLRAVGFRMGALPDYLAGARAVDVAGRPVLNTYRGRTNVELEIKDIKKVT